MTNSGAYSVAGDAGVGEYDPPALTEPTSQRVSEDLLRRVRSLHGAASTASDLLDELGINLVTDGLHARHVQGVVAGHVVTLAYLPERRAISDPELRRGPSRLAHHTVFAFAHVGDVVVIDARGITDKSVLGGVAAAAAHTAGVSGCIVDGAVRDLDEVRASGLSLWSRALTPRTGKWRLEAATVNQAVMCGGVQVVPGDVAVADDTGVCFIPAAHAESVLSRIVEISDRERVQRRP